MAETYIVRRADHDRSMAIVGAISRATHDARFRMELRRDPVGTAARAGLTLSAAEWAGLREVVSS